MRPRRKQSAVSLLPTITEVQESGPQSLDDYLYSIRVLSQHHQHPHYHYPSSWYPHHHSTSSTHQAITTTPLHPQPCTQTPTRMPTPRQARYPLMASHSSSSSSSSLAAGLPASSMTANPGLALALVGPTSLGMMSPQQTQLAADGKAWWWPHQDPLSWLFTQSQSNGVTAVAAAAAVVTSRESASDAVCLV